MSGITIEPAARWLPSELDGLRREADDEGVRIVGAVIDQWVDGTPLGCRPRPRRPIDRVGTGTHLDADLQRPCLGCGATLLESLGFEPVDVDGITHRQDLARRDLTAR